jgi:hypothetical protein
VTSSVAHPTTAVRWTRNILVAGYLVFAGFGLLSPEQPRVFWTVLLPLVPVAIVVMGFSTWRRICPLAAFGDAGRRLNRGRQRRVPPWLESWFFPVTFALLLAMLVLRLVATNGDRLWLAGLLAGLAVAAAATNAVFTGKTWCNFFCPVGLVERIYTEPNSLRSTPNSQCAQCTACKRHCPDIDQENAYWKDLATTGRRMAVYAFPGLVLAFYVYYWLRHGDWEAYFDGRWTRSPADAELVLGPGLFFAPQVPALLAATLTLLAFSAASYGLLRLLEAGLGGVVPDPERRRHLVLALAAFAAFNLFYVFAGAPTLRRVPGGTRAVAFTAPLVGTLFLVKRWRRTPQRFIRERGAMGLLRAWPFEEPPPNDPGEVYGWIRASQHAREKDLAAYANTVRDMLADGLVRSGELRLLEGVRKQLGISEREHEQVLARLSEEERHLFEEGAAPGVETRAQLDGYRTALAEALLRAASEDEIEELRERLGVRPEDHRTVLERIRGASGELLSRARRQLERALRLRRDLATIGATEPTAARIFLCHLLVKAREESVDRLFELLEIAGDGPVIQALHRRLLFGDQAQRDQALKVLPLACPGAEGLVRDLEPLVSSSSPSGAGVDPGGEAQTLGRLLGERNPYLRAGAAWAAAEVSDDSLRAPLARAREDGHPLVRETARRFADVPGAVGRGNAERVQGAEGERDTSSRSGPSSLSAIEIMHFLHVVPFFADLDPGDLYDISSLGLEETIAPPEAICEEGDIESDALFVVVSGEAVVLGKGKGSPEAERARAILGRGEVIGELSILDGSPRSATVRPQGGPVRVLRIPGQSLRGSLLRRPRVARSLLGVLTGRVRRLYGQAAETG